MTANTQLSLLPSSVPVLKWCGNKSWLAPKLTQEILPLLATGATYHELFAGSAALFFSLRSQWQGHAILSDKLPELIRVYQAIRNTPVELCAEIHALLAPEQEFSDVDHEAYYYLVRKRYNEDLRSRENPITNAACFLYLNYRGFNGLYRTNQAGQCTVAYGGRRTYFPSPETILGASKALEETHLTAMDFERIPDTEYKPGDVVFADPPYDGTYTGYAGGFSAEDQARLATRLQELSRRGVHIFATNADTERIRALYEWASFEVLTTRYVIGGERKQVAEVLIRNRREK